MKITKQQLQLLYAWAFVICLANPSVTQAQVAQGKWLVGGALTYQTGSEFEFAGQKISALGTDVSAFGFAPSVGYFLTDKVAVGARLGLAFASEEQTVAGQQIKFNANGFAIAPYGRYYLPLGNSKAYFFGEAYVNMGSIGLSRDGDNLLTFNLFQAGLNPGFAYFISDRISFELRVNGINFSSFKEKEATKGNNVFNFGPNFGQQGPSLAIHFLF